MMTTLKSTAISILMGWFVAAGAHADSLGTEYKKLSASCVSCNEIDKLLEQYNASTSARAQLDIALNIAHVIEHISVQGKSLVEQRRAFYFAINATIEVLADDFDSETVVNLLDLRQHHSNAFDDVFWPSTDPQALNIAVKPPRSVTDGGLEDGQSARYSCPPNWRACAS